MDLVGVKICLGAIVLLINIIVACVSTVLIHVSFNRGAARNSRFLDILFAMSAGVIFGLFFFSIAPEISTNFAPVLGYSCALSPFLSNLAPVVAMLLVWMLDQGVHVISGAFKHRTTVSETTPLSQTPQGDSTEKPSEPKISLQSTLILFFLTVALGLHAFFEGIGVGIMSSKQLAITMAVVLSFHEWICIVTVVYRLTDHFRGQHLGLQTPVVITYAFLLPTGILVGTGLSSGFGILGKAILMSVVGGALLFVSLIESLPRAFASSMPRPLLFLTFASGVAIISVLVGVSVSIESRERCFRHPVTELNATL